MTRRTDINGQTDSRAVHVKAGRAARRMIECPGQGECPARKVPPALGERTVRTVRTVGPP